MKIVPITQREARRWMDQVHRHLPAPRGDVIRVGLERDGQLVGVGMAGRPTARLLQDARTLEITRVAVLDGIQNGCSKIYGALRRAAVALGWERVITYTRQDESGSSLRGAGFRRVCQTAGGEWNRPSRPREPTRQPVPKFRWESP